MGETSIGQRLRTFVEGKRPDPAEIRNHLSVSGPPEALRSLLEGNRPAAADGPALRLGDEEWPVGYHSERIRVARGSWTTITENGEPRREDVQSEEAQAVYAFASTEPIDDALARISERHPDLLFRHASFRHRSHRDDVARGALWQAGHRVAVHEHTVGDEPRDASERDLLEWHAQQLQAIVEETERLELPASA